mmetsp:Transcript_20280/g.29327  ORF Transcript_20280/g.29327 Transcript_20280/m.29327 type:complete len:311 (+) Transcript_20280:364-1296(+)
MPLQGVDVVGVPAQLVQLVVPYHVVRLWCSPGGTRVLVRAAQDRVHPCVGLPTNLLHELGHGVPGVEEGVVRLAAGPLPRKEVVHGDVGQLLEPGGEGVLVVVPRRPQQPVRVVHRAVPLVLLDLEQSRPAPLVQGVGLLAVGPEPVGVEQDALPQVGPVAVVPGQDLVRVDGVLPVGHRHGRVDHLQALLELERDPGVVVQESRPQVHLVARSPGADGVQLHKVGDVLVFKAVDLLAHGGGCGQHGLHGLEKGLAILVEQGADFPPHVLHSEGLLRLAHHGPEAVHLQQGHCGSAHLGRQDLQLRPIIC